MKTKAIWLKSDVPKAVFSVEQLFAAAFGPEPIEYHHKSLLGWRPLDLSPDTYPRLAQKPSVPDKTLLPDSPSGVKVFETEALIVVEVELPAIDEDSLYLEISGYKLIIRGNRLSPKASKRRRPAKQADREIYRCIQLPVFARPGEVRARLDGNIVRVMIRKRQQAR